MKFKITNTSGSSEKGSRNIFVMDAGKNLEPGHVCYANRIQPSTRRLEETKALKIETGDFAAPPIFKKEPVKAPIPPTENQKESQAKAAEQARAMDERMAAEAKATAEAEEKAAAETAAEAEAKAAAEESSEAKEEDSESNPDDSDEKSSSKRGRRSKSKK